MKSQELLTELIERTNTIIKRVESLKMLEEPLLNRRNSAQEWSALECIAHLNFLGDFYNNEIKNKLENNSTKPSINYKGGWFGNLFVKRVSPGTKDAPIKKVKTSKSMNPIGSHLGYSTLQTFIIQQREFINLLEKARDVNLQKTKTVISITNFIKLQLGDSFRVQVAHNERHIDQAEEAVL